ncbi:MAG: helix-turn-helix domain-containing protein [Eubacterium sp.]|nr:helix-turn-helix domain-containing protein [Eubacterium sp.]
MISTDTAIISDAKSFGQALKRRRKELHYTQAYISEFTGFSTSFISELENGKETAELEKALYLASLLGLNFFLEKR